MVKKIGSSIHSPPTTWFWSLKLAVFKNLPSSKLTGLKTCWFKNLRSLEKTCYLQKLAGPRTCCLQTRTMRGGGVRTARRINIFTRYCLVWLPSPHGACLALLRYYPVTKVSFIWILSMLLFIYFLFIYKYQRTLVRQPLWQRSVLHRRGEWPPNAAPKRWWTCKLVNLKTWRLENLNTWNLELNSKSNVQVVLSAVVMRVVI